MLKQTVQFTDFDDVNKTRNLYFNLTRTEVIDNLELQHEFQEVQDMIGGETRDLEMHEVKLILELVKKIMRISYGVQKEVDGNLSFTKKDVWEPFTETAAYDEFLIGLFENPERAVAFLVGIWPKEIRDGIDVDQLSLPGIPVPGGQPGEVSVGPIPVPREPLKEPKDPLSEYTDEALLAMPQTEFDTLVGTNPLSMSQRGLRLAFVRKTTHK